MNTATIKLDPARIQAAKESHAFGLGVFARRSRSELVQTFETEGEAREALRGFLRMNAGASGYVDRWTCDSRAFVVHVSNRGLSYCL